MKASLLPSSGAERAVRVVTTSLVNEPVVTVYLVAGCRAKITRKFVAFADPPGAVNLPEADAASGNRAAATSSPADDFALVPAGRGEGRAAARFGNSGTSAKSSTRRSKSVANAAAGGEGIAAGEVVEGRPVASAKVPFKVPTDHKASAVPAKRSPQAAVPKTETARLVLDPTELDALTVPNLMMSSALSGVAANIDAPEVKERRAAAAALWAAMNSSPEQLARDRQRMQELEQRLARLQQESSGAQSRVAAMEARVREAEDKRLKHPLVYGLLALCVLLGAAVAWLFTRQRREAAEPASSWWQGEPADGGASGAAETAPAVSSMAEPALARTAAEFMPVRPAPTTGAPAPAASPAVAAPLVAASVAEPPQGGSTTISRPVLIKNEQQEAREITVEELIDLEQQAEFFVVLGQDDAAIELLEGHVQNTAVASPLPYLKLLEIYQRLDRRDDYERVRSVFNSRFNAYAPSWESDLQHGHALEDYPGVIDRLQALWSVPTKAMDVLEVSLTRSDGSAETFDLPAYRELLFLYGVARDLSERESQDRAPVDLLLPVQDHDADASDEVNVPTMLQPLMATRPVKALPEVTPSLSLDLSLDDPVPPEAGGGALVDSPEPSASGKKTTDDSNGIDFEHVDLPQRKP
ncbi:MAG TPA: hypothetical protein H9903_05215 [Candidatus Aquabacterium excrementipullorum]|nr:hypothetical protein [Candidatus Aquabacterium excrementipullorum]